MRAMRWGDNDRYFGPFTYAVDPRYPHWAVILKSTDDENRGTSLRISLGKRTLIVALPPIVRPWKRKVVASGWDAATVERLGRDWYWDIHPREYGISYSEGFLQIPYGRSTHDSSTEQRWSCFLPWTQWRQVSHVLYDAEGVASQNIASAKWEVYAPIKAALSKVKFAIEDFDGEKIAVDTYIEERVWLLGTGLFKWLGFFAPAKRRRSLDIAFSSEVGPEKGSWKGGTLGTGIEMLPGETHERAFRRFCEEDHRSKYRKYRIKLVSPAVSVSEPSS